MTTVISVDLDPLATLHAVYGLKPPGPDARGRVMQEGLSRFLELFAAVGAKATFFVVGEALRDCAELYPRVIETMQEAQRNGHRFGNHSWAHRYDLAHCDRAVQHRELKSAHEELSRHGLEVQGFRAPGYTHSRALLDEVAALGYRYDSSRLPSPLYYAAKIAAIAKMAISGRNSASSRKGAACFLGGDRPRLLPQSSLWDVPISVTPRLRLPMHGALLLRQRGAVAQMVRDYARSAAYVHMHFHGSDLMEGEGNSIHPDLLRVMPELQLALSNRLSSLRSLLNARDGGISIEEALALPSLVE